MNGYYFNMQSNECKKLIQFFVFFNIASLYNMTFILSTDPYDNDFIKILLENQNFFEFTIDSIDSTLYEY